MDVTRYSNELYPTKEPRYSDEVHSTKEPRSNSLSRTSSKDNSPKNTLDIKEETSPKDKPKKEPSYTKFSDRLPMLSFRFTRSESPKQNSQERIPREKRRKSSVEQSPKSDSPGRVESSEGSTPLIVNQSRIIKDVTYKVSYTNESSVIYNIFKITDLAEGFTFVSGAKLKEAFYEFSYNLVKDGYEGKHISTTTANILIVYKKDNSTTVIICKDPEKGMSVAAFVECYFEMIKENFL